MALEFGGKSIPALTFFILGTYRFYGIRDYGQGQYKYSRHFKAKLGISIAMFVADILYMVLIFIFPADMKHSSWINRCDQDWFGLFYGFQGLAWLFSGYLMTFEYKRLLSEEWYSNQLFWVLNFICEFTTFCILFDEYIETPVMLTTAFFNIFANITLIVLMFRTKRRTLASRRPQTGEVDPLLLSSDVEERRVLHNSFSGPFIRVKCQEKCISVKGINFFQFRVEMHDKKTDVKVRKTLQEF